MQLFFYQNIHKQTALIQDLGIEIIKREQIHVSRHEIWVIWRAQIIQTKADR